jgi:hypothetical protein
MEQLLFSQRSKRSFIRITAKSGYGRFTSIKNR